MNGTLVSVIPPSFSGNNLGGIGRTKHTGVDLGIDLDSRIGWNPAFGELNTLKNRNTMWNVSTHQIKIIGSAEVQVMQQDPSTTIHHIGEQENVNLPLADDGVVFHARKQTMR